jgi:diguanylate cyclase (GGDEF)-like protein
MWFGTANGVVRVDPREQRGNTLAPPVAVERMLVDGRDVDPDAAPTIGPGVERVEFRYAGMSYVAPAAVRYRYRMEGFDRGWTDAGASRVASYTNLPPGDYVFRVVASNNDGVWSEQGADVAFVLAPRWFETWWFRAFAAAATLLLLGAFYRVRVWRLHERQRELTREVAQRTDALRRANSELQRMAELDGLTRIANRSAFDRRLREAWDEHAAAQRPLAVLLCDIDAFKAYNDTYGHLAGDAALIEVARSLGAGLRSGADLAARYGGEEFAVLLLRCDEREATAAARRMLDGVRALAIEHRSSGVAASVTISIGVASRVPGAAQEPEVLLRSADEALYRAKAGGRDRMAEAARA